MWYRILKRRIELGNLTDIDNTLKFFVATGDITVTQYDELVALLPTQEA